MWTCPTCGEQHEDQFDSCWKCAPAPAEAVLSEAEPLPLSAEPGPVEEDSALPDDELLEQAMAEADRGEDVPKSCERCKVTMEIIGFERLTMGTAMFSWPPILEAWKCPRCKRVELYDS